MPVSTRKKPQAIHPALLLLIAALLCILLSLLVIKATPERESEAPVSETAPSVLPFDSSAPFSLSDLEARWVQEIQKSGSLHLSDGPRGISVGDSIDKIFTVYPTDYSGAQPADEQILYCADYFENANGVMTALPPRGLLTEEEGREIVILLLSPVSAYPPGTRDNYRNYEHVYCRYRIEPETMTVSSIVVGLTR